MAFEDTEEPPNKKRRFFTEKSEILDTSLTNEPSLPDEIDVFSPVPPTKEEEAELENGPEDVGQPNGGNVQRESPQDEGVLSGFDQETFESFVGGKVEPNVLSQLRAASGDNMERAVNMYFDGSWKAAPPPRKSSSLTINGFARSSSSGNANSSIPPRTENPPAALRDTMPEYRYIGAFGVGAWATRSGNSLVKHGEPVRIERQKIKPPKASFSKGRGRPAATQATPNQTMLPPNGWMLSFVLPIHGAKKLVDFLGTVRIGFQHC